MHSLPETRMKLYPFIDVSYISDCIPASCTPDTVRFRQTPHDNRTEFDADPHNRHPAFDSLSTPEYIVLGIVDSRCVVTFVVSLVFMVRHELAGFRIQ